MTSEIDAMERVYTLECYGLFWNGARGVYSYTLSAFDADCLMRGQKTIYSAGIAGDFKVISDWRLIRCTHSYTHVGRGMYRRVDEYKTLRGFRNGMTPNRFYKLANT